MECALGRGTCTGAWVWGRGAWHVHWGMAVRGAWQVHYRMALGGMARALQVFVCFGHSYN